MARCDTCGNPLEVGARQERRLRISGKGLCRSCRRPSIKDAGDEPYRFWADRYGVPVPAGQTARAVLVASAGRLPRELSELIDGFR